MNKIEKQIINAKRQVWHNEKKAEFKALFPDVIELDEDGNELESFSEAFGSWLNELEQYEVTTTDEDGNEVINTYSRKLRPMPNFTVTQADLLTNETYQKQQKEEALKTLDITVLPNGLRFHTDDKSLLDLMIADREAEKLGANDTDATLWKTVDGIKQVTIADIRNAISTRLSNKAKIVGVN